MKLLLRKARSEYAAKLSKKIFGSFLLFRKALDFKQAQPFNFQEFFLLLTLCETGFRVDGILNITKKLHYIDSPVS